MNKRFFSQQGVYPRHISARFPERQREIIRSSAYNFTEKWYENENVQTHIHDQRKMERENEHRMQKCYAHIEWVCWLRVRNGNLPSIQCESVSVYTRNRTFSSVCQVFHITLHSYRTSPIDASMIFHNVTQYDVM